MADKQKRINIVLTGNADDAVEALRRTINELEKADGASKKTSAGFRDFGSKVDAMGRQSMIAMRSIGDASNLIGFDKTLTQSIGNAAMMTDTVGDLAGAFTMLNPVMLAVAAAGAVLAFAFQKIKEEQERAAEFIKAQAKHYQDLHGAMAELGKASDSLARKLQEQFDLDTKAATAVAELARTNENYRSAVDERITADEELTRTSKELGQEYQILLQLERITDEYTGGLTEAYYEQQKTVDGLRQKLLQLSAAREGDIRSIKQHALALEDDRVASARDRAETGQWISKQANDKLVADYQKLSAGATDYAGALNKVADAQNSMLKSMVEKALTPTSVTSADMDATKKGTYKDKWDELAREADDVATSPENIAKYPKLQEALKQTGLAADVFADKFRNMTLFADPKNLNLVGWQAMGSSIGDQLQGLVGKANLMKEGFAKAWAGLTADQKKSLRELGINSEADAKKALTGAADSGVAGFVGQMGDKETVKQLKGAGDTLVKNVQAGIMDKDTQKAWLGTMDTLLQSAIGQFSVKENIKSLTDAGANMLAAIAKGLQESTALTDAMMAAVDKAIKDAIEYLKSNYGGESAGTGAAVPVPAVPGFAAGGIGYFKRGGLIRVDTGEGYAFTGKGGGVPSIGGGTSINITYAPQMSLATRAEATAMLESVVNDINRKLSGRRA